MTKRVAVMLGDGFEPVEVVGPVDCMRRAGIEVELISVMPTVHVISAQNISMDADVLIENTDLDDFDMLVVPGGSVGVDNLKKSQKLADALIKFMESDKHVASICAGPTVLAALGLLKGRKATCYPGCETVFPDGVYQKVLGVVVDNNLITASGPGQALEFGIAIANALSGRGIADQVASGMLIGS